MVRREAVVLTLPVNPETYLNQRDLEARWQLSGRTLGRWRAESYGPAWYVLGGSIRYRLSDIEAFEAQHRHRGSAFGSKPERGSR